MCRPATSEASPPSPAPTWAHGCGQRLPVDAAAGVQLQLAIGDAPVLQAANARGATQADHLFKSVIGAARHCQQLIPGPAQPGDEAGGGTVKPSGWLCGQAVRGLPAGHSCQPLSSTAAPANPAQPSNSMRLQQQPPPALPQATAARPRTHLQQPKRALLMAWVPLTYWMRTAATSAPITSANTSSSAARPRSPCP